MKPEILEEVKRLLGRHSCEEEDDIKIDRKK
jgi:hypothetical protein